MYDYTPQELIIAEQFRLENIERSSGALSDNEIVNYYECLHHNLCVGRWAR